MPSSLRVWRQRVVEQAVRGDLLAATVDRLGYRSGVGQLFFTPSRMMSFTSLMGML